MPLCIRLKKNAEFSNLFDVELEPLSAVRPYDALECHVVLYPYSRKVRSHHILFAPFEEYVRDLADGRKSVYAPIPNSANSIFGLLLGLVLALVFWSLDWHSLVSIEAVVGVLGAYFIGKDLWDDIAEMLVNLSKRWRLRYQRGYYVYQLEKNTTLGNYAALARESRYGRAALLPEQMDFIPNSNSQTLRLWFGSDSLHRFSQDTAHLLSMRIEAGLLDDFERGGYMFGIKLALNRSVLGLVRSDEYFQSLHHGVLGCLDEKGRWTEGALLTRRVYRWGSLRYQAREEVCPGQTLIILAT